MSKINDKMKKTLLAVKQAYKSENEDQIKQIEDVFSIGLDRKSFLQKHTELKLIYDKVGNNPLDAPTLFVAESDFAINDYINVVEEGLELDLSKYPIEDALLFTGFIWTKVHSFYDDNGKIKSTVNTEKATTPNTKTIAGLSQLEVDLREALAKMYEGYDPDIDDAVEFTNELNLMKNKSHDDKKQEIFKITGVKMSDLTDWEQDLLVQDITSYVAYSIDKGKSSFKGYL